MTEIGPQRALSGQDGAIRLALRVQPGARRSALVGMYGDRLRVAVRAPPVDGKANAAVIELVASVLGLHRRAVQLLAGQSSRDKVLQVDASRQVVVAALRLALGQSGG